MSSNASTAEHGVSAELATTTGLDATDIDSTTATRTQFDVEREILCNYIEDLERELRRERRRREQVVDHYERLLASQQQEAETRGRLRTLLNQF